MEPGGALRVSAHTQIDRNALHSAFSRGLIEIRPTIEGFEFLRRRGK